MEMQIVLGFIEDNYANTLFPNPYTETVIKNSLI